MNRKTYLGELEQMVLLSVLRLGKEAYASAVREELIEQTGRRVARGAVYITLDRLVKKGYLSSRLGNTSPDRGGRANRFFKPTREGQTALRAARSALVNLWTGFESVLEDR